MEENEIKIGDQTWTSKNLDLETYRNGDVIPQVQDATEWANLSTGAWCYYENESANGTTYGKLYNWYAVNDPRGLAPNGYHIPTDAERTILTDYLGGEVGAGTEMKSTTGWEDDGNGTNTSGFAGLPGGYRDHNGDFFSRIGALGYWWSSSDESYNPFQTALYHSPTCAWCRHITWCHRHIDRNSYGKGKGYSVRCLRD